MTAPHISAALIGHGIAGSLTPAMHEAEGRAQGFAYDYARFDTGLAPFAKRPLADLLTQAEAEGRAGVNITHPFKREAVALADELSEVAAALGAINTMVFDGGRRIGHNTDHTGFATALARDLGGARFGEVLLVGTGGAGAAVALALIDHGVDRLVLRDTAPGRAEDLARRLSAVRPNAKLSAVTETDHAGLDGVVNATPLGMADHPGCAVDVSCLPREAWVADVVYVPIETELIAAARVRGHRVMTGGAMAVFQAVGSFELFTGRPAEPARMAAHFETLQRPAGTDRRARQAADRA